MKRAAIVCAFVLPSFFMSSASAAVLYADDFASLGGAKGEGGATCQVAKAPGGKSGNALRVSNVANTKNATATLTCPRQLPNGVTVVFRLYIDRYTGEFQAVYNHPPGEGVRFMPGGKLQGSCGESLEGEWKEKTWYTVALVLGEAGGVKAYLRPGLSARITDEDFIGDLCGNGRPMKSTTIFNYGGDLYVADYAVNEGVDFTIQGAVAEAEMPKHAPQPCGRYALPLAITSDLPFPNIPMDPSIPFGRLIRTANIRGVLDQNAIAVRDLDSGALVPRAVERFTDADTLKVEWLVAKPDHRKYQIEFATTPERRPVLPQRFTPLIGVGDLLRYNAGVPRPIMPGYPSGLYDLTGDGKPDLVGVWNYGRRPGDRWDGIVVFPRVGDPQTLEFGDLVRLYEVPDLRYSRADVGDFDQDGRPDIVFAPSTAGQMTLYHNTGKRHATGLPVFEASGTVPRSGGWNVRVADLDGDGAPDIIAGGGFPDAETGVAQKTTYLRNVGSKKWPPTFKDMGPMEIAGAMPVFFDVDGDGRLDAVSLMVDSADPGLSGFKVGWQKNLGGSPPKFGKGELLGEVNAATWRPMDLAVSPAKPTALLVEDHNWERLAVFVRRPGEGRPYLQAKGVLGSISAELTLSDQAWPYPCDWNGDGKWDLLVGGGYGWPRILLNEGSNERPAFTEPQLIESEGQPIRILRNPILGPPKHWHNMGYPYPAYVDWDGDGLPDLVIPNETNRIFWYKNIGTRQQPKFGPRQQLLPDGYVESAEKKAESARLALKAVYPKEEQQPFFWRTCAAFADFNHDGLMDMATHDGATRKLSLFVQYRDSAGHLKLRQGRPLKLQDGRLIDESVVGRSSGWTEGFKAIDWDGDGRVDVVYSLAGKSGDMVYLLRNVGTPEEPVFANPEPIRLFGEPINITAHGPQVAVADLDGDGRPEVIGCTEWSVYAFYRGTALAMSKRPSYTLGECVAVTGATAAH